MADKADWYTMDEITNWRERREQGVPDAAVAWLTKHLNLAYQKGRSHGAREPKYHVNQVLRNLHSWAASHPPRPVIEVLWDESWGCYTYSFPLSHIMIEEQMLAPTGEADTTPDLWLWLEKIRERGKG